MDARTLFFEQFDRATESAKKVADSLHHNHWRDRPQYFFGPGEVFVHLAQSERFNLAWVLRDLGRNPEFVMPKVFAPVLEEQDAAKRRALLSAINLEHARDKLCKLASREKVQDWWQNQRTVTRGMLLGLPPELLTEHVCHPLVAGIEGPCVLVCAELFNAHLYYHCGQVTQESKHCHEYQPPFLMGYIDTTVV